MKDLVQLIEYLNSNKLVLATAESCTGGEIMANLAKQGNCGACLFIGYVVYNELAKQKELGVKKSTIAKHSLTSEEVAREMVIGVFQHQEINVAIATTGITGDESMDGIPPGTICFAWGFKSKSEVTVFSETKIFKDSPKRLPRKAAQYALSKVEKYHHDFLDLS
jgi:nicotinamide-nucleotide amidase